MTRTPWAGSTSPGFPRSTRTRILHRDPTCRCPGCPHCTPTGCHQPSTDADHIVAVADGGTHDETNGQGMCHGCHQRKTVQHAAAARARRPTPQRTPESHPGLAGPSGPA